MLKITNIYKTYGDRDNKVRALKNVSLTFRNSEFVSILGPSGCGKTTLLNIIGGLDRYNKGDLIINGRSTKRYRDKDWDTYRNYTIGFVFQTYNLIPHLTVLENVEMALTLSGVSKRVRKHKAKVVLKSVGLLSQINKKPNQLSGGQMQRVSIARALINNPDIILADEPTGALDTQTSIQVMDILKEIAKDRLVIMVTHNPDLAERYSTRIIKLLDGELVSDSNPIREDEIIERKPRRRQTQSKMSFATAVNSSLKNLWSKKGRTFITGFAGSIGIIGIALVLSLSTGLKSYIANLQAETMLEYPIQIMRVGYKEEDLLKIAEEYNSTELEEFPEEEVVLPYTPVSTSDLMHYNTLTKEYVEYVDNIDPSLITAVKYNRSLQMNILTKGTEDGTTTYKKLNTSKVGWQELVSNQEYIQGKYDILSGRLPDDYKELVVVVDRYNRITIDTLNELRIEYREGRTLSFDDIIGTEIKLILNNDYYKESEGVYSAIKAEDYRETYNLNSAVSLKIVGIIRINQDTNFDLMQTGVFYSNELTDYVLDNSAESRVAKAQELEDNKNVLTGLAFSAAVTKESVMQTIGASTIPTSIEIYPLDFDSKDLILEYLDDYNTDKEEKDKVFYIDVSAIALTMVATLIDVISYVLIAFSSVSLVVSSIMIGIITYVSVIERTKEIGVLRAIGARKKDISRIFNAETLIIGLVAGLLGVSISAGLCLVINRIISNLVGVAITAYLPLGQTILLIAISMTLTFIAGLVPSRIAAKKDPVVALRTE